MVPALSSEECYAVGSQQRRKRTVRVPWGAPPVHAGKLQCYDRALEWWHRARPPHIPRLGPLARAGTTCIQHCTLPPNSMPPPWKSNVPTDWWMTSHTLPPLHTRDPFVAEVHRADDVHYTHRQVASPALVPGRWAGPIGTVGQPSGNPIGGYYSGSVRTLQTSVLCKILYFSCFKRCHQI